MTLDELNINQFLKKNLQELIKNERLPHAILIDAGSIEQRNQLSDYFSQVFVCTDANKPCGKCSQCIKASNHSHPDIIISDPDDIDEKTFKIGVVRNIRQDAYIIPNEADKKVYILRQADKMNAQAQNALLKIIEEPPSYARFIIECSSRVSMLETVRSRVTSFGLGAEHLNIDNKSDEKADEIAMQLAQALMQSTELDFMRITSAFEKDKDLLSRVLPQFQLIFRDAVIIKTGSTSIVGRHHELSKNIASKFSINALIEIIKQIDSFNMCINQNANKNLLITRFSSVIRNIAYGG